MEITDDTVEDIWKIIRRARSTRPVYETAATGHTGTVESVMLQPHNEGCPPPKTRIHRGSMSLLHY